MIIYSADGPAPASVGALSQIVFYRAQVKEGQITVNEKRMRQVVALKTQNPSLKVLVNLEGLEGWKAAQTVFSSPEALIRFAVQVKTTLADLEVDGVEIYWLSLDGPTPYTSDMRDHLTQLVTTLRKVLGPQKMIIVFAPGASPLLQSAADWMAIAPWINRVTLTMCGGSPWFSHTVLHNNALFSESGQPASVDLDSYVFKDAAGLFLSCKPGYMLGQINATQSPFPEYWDSVACMPYRYSAQKKVFFTYENARSLALKATYVKDKGLAGLSVLAIYGDPGGLMDTLARSFRQSPPPPPPTAK